MSCNHFLKVTKRKIYILFLKTTPTMGNLENSIKKLLMEENIHVPEKIGLEYNGNSTFDELADMYKAVKNIEKAYDDCFNQYVNDTNNKSDKFSVFNFDIKDFENIFSDIKVKMFDDLYMPGKVNEGILKASQILYNEPDTLTCLGSLIAERKDNKCKETSAFLDKAIREEFKDADEKIKRIYEHVNESYENLGDTNNILKKYDNVISEYGRDEFKNKILDYMKEEYGYGDLADSLRNVESFEQISNKLRTATIDDLPFSDTYHEIKRRIEDNKATPEDKKILLKIENESQEMKNELKQFACYFKPDLSHYKDIRKVCREFMGKLEMNYKEGFLASQKITNRGYD